MKISLLFISFLFITGCVQTDFEPEIDPILKISSKIPSSIVENETFTFSANYFNTRGRKQDVAIVWESKNPEVIRIDANLGKVLALKAGTAAISVSFDGVKDNTKEIEVLPSKERIEIFSFRKKLQIGNSVQFRARYLDLKGVPKMSEKRMWSSSAPLILSVDDEGNVSALTIGTSQISVSVGNVSHSVMVESFEEEQEEENIPEQITIIDFKPVLNVEETYTLVAQFFDTSGVLSTTTTIHWSSTNEAVVSIDQNGVATAKSVGMATIKASAGLQPVESEMEVTVIQPSERQVNLQGNGGYNISGTGVLRKNSEGNLILELKGVVVSGPGPYFYLSNHSKNINNGINLGKSSNGDFEFDITSIDPNATINSYDYLVVWCKPYGITLGFGQFDN